MSMGSYAHPIACAYDRAMTGAILVQSSVL